MKTRLLKLIRKRFKWKYAGDGIWDVYDKKGTSIEQIPDVNRLTFEINYRTISNVSAAEYLAQECKTFNIVFNHRANKSKRQNRAFVKKHFK